MLLASSPIREAHCTYSFCASGFTRERNTVITIATLLSCTFLELPARLFYPCRVRTGDSSTLPAARRPRRVFARACVDLTQRRAHLGGALGDALLELYVARGWIQRHRRSRVVSITPMGHENFRRLLGIRAFHTSTSMSFPETRTS